MAISKKRAQVFSMIAIMMSLLFIILFSGMTHVPLDRKVPIIKAEVSRVDAFVKDFDRLVINAIDRATFGSLAQFALLQQEVSSVDPTIYFDNFSQAFESCFTGTSYDYNAANTMLDFPCDSSITLGSEGYNFSFAKYLEDLFYLASQTFNVSINYSDVNAHLSQQKPFELTVNVSMNVQIQRNDYSWNRFIFVQRNVPINGMDHPIIANRTIHFPSSKDYSVPHNFKINRFDADPVIVADFIDNGYYFLDNRSPSIIDLFEGNFPGPGGFSQNNFFGITSILPGNESFSVRGDVYLSNQSSSLEYDYLFQNTYASSSLRRISSPTIAPQQLLPEAYLSDMGFDTNSPPIYLVS